MTEQVMSAEEVSPAPSGWLAALMWPLFATLGFHRLRTFAFLTSTGLQIAFGFNRSGRCVQLQMKRTKAHRLDDRVFGIQHYNRTVICPGPLIKNLLRIKKMRRAGADFQFTDKFYLGNIEVHRGFLGLLNGDAWAFVITLAEADQIIDLWFAARRKNRRWTGD